LQDKEAEAQSEELGDERKGWRDMGSLLIIDIEKINVSSLLLNCA
jgi:hypothetical protein